MSADGTVAKFTRIPTIILAFLVLSTACVSAVVMDGRFAKPPKPSSDGPIYENIGFHLSQGRGFWMDFHDPVWRSVYEQGEEREQYHVYLDTLQGAMPATGRPPLFPAMLAMLYLVIERGETAFASLRVASALMIALSSALAVACVGAILGHPRESVQITGTRSIYKLAEVAGCLAAVILAASQRTLLSYASDFLTEPLALMLTQILICLLLLAVGKTPSGLRQPLLLSLVLAAMILNRSLFVLWLPGVAVLMIIVSGGELWRRCREACWMLVFVCLLMFPWWLRNCIVLERFMPLGTQGPITMLGGYCDEALAAGGDWQPQPEQRLREALRSDPEYLACATEVERELLVADRARQLVRQWIVEHLESLPGMFWQRVVTHWNPYFGRSLVWKLLALQGALWLMFNRRPEAWILVGLPLMNTVIVALLYTTGGRFLVPLYGAQFTLAGIGVASLLQIAASLSKKFQSSPQTGRLI